MAVGEQGVIVSELQEGATSLGIEFGSTRIKAVLIDHDYRTLATGDVEWENRLEDGLWTYSMDQIHQGLQAAYAAMAEDVRRQYGVTLTKIGAMGISAMMHGYLAFDKDGQLLVPFRTWRNTNTRQAHEELSQAFKINIPERWSIAHLYQAILNGEEHVPRVAYITTLAGYMHWRLSGRKVIGIGDASGMFPIDSSRKEFDQGLLDIFSRLPQVKDQPWDIHDLLPEPLTAGSDAGALTAEGAALLDPSGQLQPGVPMAPPEGDAGTGMVATNAVRPRTGNVSAGTSIFAMVVLEHPLRDFHPEVDPVTTPAGDPAGMSHANNFTSDLNAWVGLFGDFAKAAGLDLKGDALYATLFNQALLADKDAGGLINYCFYSGEFLAGLEEGRPVFARGPEGRMTLANFMRAQLFSAFSPVTIGMDVMTRQEHVQVDTMVGHGGIFATPKVAQRILAAAFNAPIKVMSTAVEGGAWGMAVLADYLGHADQTLADYLDANVFAGVQSTTEQPDPADVKGFRTFFDRFTKGLPIEQAAVKTIPLQG